MKFRLAALAGVAWDFHRLVLRKCAQGDFSRQSRLTAAELEVDNAMVEIHFGLPQIDAGRFLPACVPRAVFDRCVMVVAGLCGIIINVE
jgi:hypothetical protein